MVIKTYQNNELIHREGDPATAIYEVKEGIIRASNTSTEGKTVLVAAWTKGDCAGESSFLDGGSRICDYYAVGTTRLGLLTKNHFDRLTDKYPEINKHLLLYLARYFRLAANKHISAEILPLRKKMIHTILSVCSEDSQGNRASLNLSQENLSGLLGAARQSVNKELRLLQKNGLIEIEPGKIHIPDIDAIQQELDQPLTFPELPDNH